MLEKSYLYQQLEKNFMRRRISLCEGENFYAKEKIFMRRRKFLCEGKKFYAKGKIFMQKEIISMRRPITPMLYRMLFLLTNVRKVWVFLRISLGKVVGMEWQASGLPPPGAGLWPVIPSRRPSRGKFWRKPIPSRHWLIRITFYIALEWY